jgi:hypothetical protein
MIVRLRRRVRCRGWGRTRVAGIDACVRPPCEQMYRAIHVFMRVSIQSTPPVVTRWSPATRRSREAWCASWRWGSPPVSDSSGSSGSTGSNHWTAGALGGLGGGPCWVGWAAGALSLADSTGSTGSKHWTGSTACSNGPRGLTVRTKRAHRQVRQPCPPPPRPPPPRPPPPRPPPPRPPRPSRPSRRRQRGRPPPATAAASEQSPAAEQM